jgi:hypothetical protein
MQGDAFGNGTKTLGDIYMKKRTTLGASPELFMAILITASVSVRYMRLQD